jgi:MSHA biogenesis protein MshK
MAEPVNVAAGLTMRSLMLAWVLCGMTEAMAQALPDPTKPPSVIAVPLQGTAAAATSGPVLQSVLLSPLRTEAIISGQRVKLGEKFGESVLIKVAEGEVVLRNGSELQTLKLYPAIDMQAVARPDSKPVRRRQQQGETR